MSKTSRIRTQQHLNIHHQARQLSKWVILLKPGVHVRFDGVITAKKPKGENFVVKNFRTMDEAHAFYFGDAK